MSNTPTPIVAGSSPERPDEHAVTLRRVVPSVDADACIIGAGPNGLVASIALADAGWDVVLVEGSHLGGAVRSVRRRPETVTDLFSAFYPLAAASPVLRALELDRHGLQWSHADVVLAHPADEKTTEAAALYRDVRQTAKQLEHDHPGDGERWQELFAEWQRLREPLLDALFSPFPPMRPAARLARLLGLADGLRLARFLLLPVRRMGEELFRASTADCFTGNALHADVPLTAPVSGTFGWLLACWARTSGSRPSGRRRCAVRRAGASGSRRRCRDSRRHAGGGRLGRRRTRGRCSIGRRPADPVPPCRAGGNRRRDPAARAGAKRRAAASTGRRPGPLRPRPSDGQGQLDSSRTPQWRADRPAVLASSTSELIPTVPCAGASRSSVASCLTGRSCWSGR